jgi:hypothetical protein
LHCKKDLAVVAEHLARELRTFESHRKRLEAESRGKFVVIRGDDIVGIYASFDAAARDAIRRFGADDIYLIRKIGSYSTTLSIAALLGRTGANSLHKSSE